AVSLKRSLWGYLTTIINRWNGECIVMGDFNEFRRKEDRWGTTFNTHGARAFNQFIASACLVEIQLEGYHYTWAHPSESKMSKLDRFLVSPILLCEVMIDYGATPFRFFSSWFDFQGFDLMVTQMWNSITLNDNNGMIRFKKKLQILKKEIREANDDLLASRMELLNQLHDFKTTETSEYIQKAKIKWAVKGDENSKFFHEEFRDYFGAWFNEPGTCHGHINYTFTNRLNEEQVADLETPITRDEIRLAVWGCGENKSPGLDGFTSEFFRKFWVVVGLDFYTAVEWFFDHASFPIGCNSSFIALILKSLEPKTVGDYRPISLIGCLYKVVTKILATRLSSVIYDLVSDVQTAFLPNRQILDGPFIINELLARCRYKKQRAMIFKVDFAKAYDSIRWDYLEAVLNSFGFGHKWRLWIWGSLYSSMASILVNGSPDSEFQFHRGLKQEDPLALYLFILIMKSLHLSFSRVIEAGVFTAFPRLYALENNKDCIVAVKMNGTFVSSFRRDVRGGLESTQLSQLLDLLDSMVLPNLDDRWVWDLNGDGIFQVKDARILLDDFFLPKAVTPTRWVKSIPIKLNIFAWKVSLNRLPTRINLFRRGVSVSPISCSIYHAGLEDLDHLLFCCSMAIDVTRSICKWWNLGWVLVDSYLSWLSWFNSIRMQSSSKMVLKGVFYTAWWSIW
nr:putative RNA-directed DNA polymerase, eukaryota, reverse transcriptase zinc-binding domain protein [Tanacetum cinerariifolium]